MSVIKTTLLLLTLFSALATEAHTDKKLVIGSLTLDTGAPYNWVDSCSGKLSGSSQHLIEKAFNELGVEVSFVPMKTTPSPDNQGASQNIEAAFGVYKALQENGYTEIAGTVDELETGIIYRKDSPYSIRQVGDLKKYRGTMAIIGKQVLALNNNDPTVLLSDPLNITPTLPDAIEQLLANKTDYVVVGQYYSRLMAMKMSIDDKVQFQNIKELNISIQLGFKPGSHWLEIVPALNKKLQTLMQQPGYTEHLNKYYLISKLSQSDC